MPKTAAQHDLPIEMLMFATRDILQP